LLKPKSKPEELYWPTCSYFAIFDGHAGNKCAEWLKDKLHSILVNQASFPKDPAQALTMAFFEAERNFLIGADVRNPIHDRSGSCAIIVLFVDNQCYVANLGDSRCFMSANHGKQIFKLSRDHKPSCTNEKERIKRNGGSTY
jgi:protein phosphatase PTC2/3